MANLEVTPVGEIVGFVAIEKPSTKFNEDGVFSCQVAFTGEAAKDMKNRIDEAMKASKLVNKGKKSANPPYSIENKTLIVKFKTKALIRKRNGETFPVTIRVYDAKNNEVNEPLGIGEGSKVRVAYSTYMWNVASAGAGVSMQLSLVQVVDLVKANFGGGGSPFDAMEGFTAAPKDNPFEAPADKEEEEEEETITEDDIDF